ncbi:MAG: M14 family metallopeptidase [Ferruginibacter sp.]
MHKTTILLLVIFLCVHIADAQQTPFEKSNGKETATYFEAVQWYKDLDKKYPELIVKEMGSTDAGYPLDLVLISRNKIFDPVKWKQQNKAVIFILNGIHPGEPDGIDACMMLARDLLQGKIPLPENTVIALVPVYNIGGALNRNSTTRVSQDGPAAFGFRGNAQNLDLNRDFTKCDSRNAQSFTRIFHWLKPDVFLDTHVSDGADYQHTMTLITTQYDKLGGELGRWLKNDFEPLIYTGMKNKNWDLIPYVDFSSTDFSKGMRMFYETPRYSSGYAALFNCLSFISETHMLKPFKQRVQSTYDLVQVFIEKTSANAAHIIQKRKEANEAVINKTAFPLKWANDSTIFTQVVFKGYEADTAISEATGLTKMFYNHAKPFVKDIKFFNSYKPTDIVQKPVAYIIPRGWHEVIDLMKLNGVAMQQLKKDSSISVTVTKIESYKSYPNPYEKHHKNYNVRTSVSRENISFLKGDFIIHLNQATNRYIIEMLEPAGDDSFFSWNFFDAVLQQKEGYTKHRWEALAAEVLKKNPALKSQLEEKKAADPKFAADADAILGFIYRHSVYYEKEHMRYPVFKIQD